MDAQVDLESSLGALVILLVLSCGSSIGLKVMNLNAEVDTGKHSEADTCKVGIC